MNVLGSQYVTTLQVLLECSFGLLEAVLHCLILLVLQQYPGLGDHQAVLPQNLALYFLQRYSFPSMLYHLENQVF